MPDRTREFIAELARNPEAVANILRTHVPDANAKCPACFLDDKLRKPWPCSVRKFAQAASLLIEAERPRNVVRIPQQHRAG